MAFSQKRIKETLLAAGANTEAFTAGLLGPGFCLFDDHLTFFTVKSDGSISLPSKNESNIATTDLAGHFCFFNDSGAATFKNNTTNDVILMALLYSADVTDTMDDDDTVNLDDLQSEEGFGWFMSGDDLESGLFISETDGKITIPAGTSGFINKDTDGYQCVYQGVTGSPLIPSIKQRSGQDAVPVNFDATIPLTGFVPGNSSFPLFPLLPSFTIVSKGWGYVLMTSTLDSNYVEAYAIFEFDADANVNLLLWKNATASNSTTNGHLNIFRASAGVLGIANGFSDNRHITWARIDEDSFSISDTQAYSWAWTDSDFKEQVMLSTTAPTEDEYSYSVIYRSNDGFITEEYLKSDGTWGSTGLKAQTFGSINKVHLGWTDPDVSTYSGAVYNTPGKYEYRIHHVTAGGVESSGMTLNLIQYLDTPVITSFLIDGGSGSTSNRSRGVNLTITADSGPDSGSEVDAVYQVKFWNSTEGESSAAWRNFTSGATYRHNLTSGAGIKTVFARVRHVSGRTSTTDTATITYTECTVTRPSWDHENVMICYGQDLNPSLISNASVRNFQGDNISLITASSEDSDFPIDNIINHDTKVTWRSDGFGASSVPAPGFTAFTVTVTWDFNQDIEIGMFALVNHNFASLRDYAGARGGFISVTLQGQPAAGVMTDLCDFSTVLSRDELNHRPNADDYRFLRITMIIVVDDAFPLPITGTYDTAWAIGRAIIDTPALIWQPEVNFQRDHVSGIADPSIVSLNLGQGRRVVDKDTYRTKQIGWTNHSLPKADHESLLNVVYRRQGVRRPIYLVLDPHNVTQGITSPTIDDVVPYTLYGHFEPSMSVAVLVNELGRLSLKFDEAQG